MSDNAKYLRYPTPTLYTQMADDTPLSAALLWGTTDDGETVYGFRSVAPDNQIFWHGVFASVEEAHAYHENWEYADHRLVTVPTYLDD